MVNYVRYCCSKVLENVGSGDEKFPVLNVSLLLRSCSLVMDIGHGQVIFYA